MRATSRPTCGRLALVAALLLAACGPNVESSRGSSSGGSSSSGGGTTSGGTTSGGTTGGGSASGGTTGGGTTSGGTSGGTTGGGTTSGATSGGTTGGGTTSGATSGATSGGTTGGGTTSGATSGGTTGGGTTSGATSGGTTSGGSTSGGTTGGGTTSGGSSSGGCPATGAGAVSVNVGGETVGDFVADAFFSGGSTFTTTSPIDTTGLTCNPPPQSVFQSERYGEFTYTIPGRTPSSAQTVTLYFQESFVSAAGERTFDVTINGAAALTAFDIFAAAGGSQKAIAKTFDTTADANGDVVIQFKSTGINNPKVCAITVAGAGGSSSGGSSTSGGATSSSGSSGSTSGGSTSSSGSSSGTSGGTTSSSGSSGSSSGGLTCPLPSTFKWTSTGPLANPKSPAGHDFVSLKDFTVVRWNGRYVVYATVFDTVQNGWNMVHLNFTDWSQMASADQFYMANSPTRGGVAPTLLYFSPKKLWVLAYQWGFTYATGTDPTNPSTWSSGKPLLSNGPGSEIDQTLICDDAKCYLFFANDKGDIYRSDMPIANFPGTFNGATRIMHDDNAGNLFEAVQVYRIKGTPTKYLMIVEAMGNGRFFRSFTATSLDGTWTPLADTQQNPFAGKANVTFADGNAWTNDISHGDVVRNDPSETMTIDPCDLQFLYQGFDKNKGADYGRLPYRPALLTLTR